MGSRPWTLVVAALALTLYATAVTVFPDLQADLIGYRFGPVSLFLAWLGTVVFWAVVIAEWRRDRG